MNSPTIKFSVANNEVLEVNPKKAKEDKASVRIDEERLFNLFTADIIKMKKTFTR